MNARQASGPSVGQAITVHGVPCRITKIRPFGTLDVVSDCGKYAWRVSGLAFGVSS